MDMASGIMGEIRRSPYTSLAALASFLSLFVAGPVFYSQKADAADVTKLEARIASLDDTVRREAAVAELSNVRRELFDITLRVNTLEREQINVDPILYKRRDELQATQRDLEARIRAMDRKP